MKNGDFEKAHGDNRKYGRRRKMQCLYLLAKNGHTEHEKPVNAINMVEIWPKHLSGNVEYNNHNPQGFRATNAYRKRIKILSRQQLIELFNHLFHQPHDTISAPIRNWRSS